MSDDDNDDTIKITFQQSDSVDEFLKLLDLQEGNMYIILRPEDKGFEIVGADLLHKDIDVFTGTQMYILFAGLMHLATSNQDLVMETGNEMINKELERKRKRELEEKGENIVIFPRSKKDIN